MGNERKRLTPERAAGDCAAVSHTNAFGVLAKAFCLLKASLFSDLLTEHGRLHGLQHRTAAKKESCPPYGKHRLALLRKLWCQTRTSKLLGPSAAAEVPRAEDCRLSMTVSLSMTAS